ncbi:ribulokinase [Parapedobacter sp. 10938]|uniref:ribulokinase n=1 Tax=Parapedobacter flavus TaxID=3110225 RepID=UPI002DB9273E|nr:ribulokinase [Parapedobacter sp. 10938]MEC3880598.1 ribulokinase [Parapedobacter sp. 10938]
MNEAKQNYVIGLDFGTDSVRALLLDAANGREISSAVSHYRRWAEGLYCDNGRSQFRQHPLDHIDAMETVIHNVLAGVSDDVIAGIRALSVDTTGSTPVAVDRHGTPLALLPGFESNPNAMFLLWKDHTAIDEAAEINQLARRWEVDYTQYSGGSYSSEWFWAKLLHVVRHDRAVAEGAYSWLEHCDWIPALLCGTTDVLAIKRSRCAAGHKAMWHAEFDGLPSQDFLTALDPRLEGIRDRHFHQTYTADEAAGVIAPEWADRTGLPRDIKIGVGVLDAHMGAVGSMIKPYALVKVIGTSTCDMLVAPAERHANQLVNGICGQVDGSIIPGMLGMEAGQSAFGDLYQWFARLLTYPLTILRDDSSGPHTLNQFADRLLVALDQQAAALPVSLSDEVALDWVNGRRTPDVNPTLTGWITGIRLGTDAPRLFKALVEATAFGSKAIVDRFEAEGIPVEQVIATGGISKKSPYVMQVLADVLERPIKTVKTEQACALGAAMCAAVVAGVHPDIDHAQRTMSPGFEGEYHPHPERVRVYRHLYRRYQQLGELQGGNIV